MVDRLGTSKGQASLFCALIVCFSAVLMVQTNIALGQESEPEDHCSGEGGEIEAAVVVECAGSGQPIDFREVTINGDVDLSSLDTIARPFRCSECVFKGEFRAQDVVFERVVDVARSTFTHGVAADGALFDSAAIFRSSTVAGTPGRGKPASFEGAVFSSIARFDTSHFFGEARFNSAIFEHDAEFRLAKFEKDAWFSQASVAGDALFERAAFNGRARFLDISVGGRLSLKDATVQLVEGQLILGDKMQVGGLEMPLRLRHAIDGSPHEDVSSREIVLEKVAATALEDGNLDLANDATFHRVSLDTGPGEFFFGRLIAGYTVKPVYPLSWMVAVLVVGTALRWASLRWTIWSPPGWFADMGAKTAGFRGALNDTWLNVRGKEKDDAPSDDGGRSIGRWIEVTAFRVFFVLSVIALGNSVPVARDLLKSVFG